MKKNSKKTWLLAIGFLVVGCDKTGSGDSLDDIYIPDFSNDWTIVNGSSSDNFFLNPTSIDSTKGTGLIVGFFEEGSDEIAVSGSFTDTKVKLTISSDSLDPGSPPLADSSYAGVYDTLAAPHLLRLANTAGPHDSLILRHG